eukprot:761919-Hanusia_phi.AAC.2
MLTCFQLIPSISKEEGIRIFVEAQRSLPAPPACRAPPRSPSAHTYSCVRGSACTRDQPEGDRLGELGPVNDSIPDDVSVVEDPLHLLLPIPTSLQPSPCCSPGHDVVVELHEKRRELLAIQRAVPDVKSLQRRTTSRAHPSLSCRLKTSSMVSLLCTGISSSSRRSSQVPRCRTSKPPPPVRRTLDLGEIRRSGGSKGERDNGRDNGSQGHYWSES